MTEIINLAEHRPHMSGTAKCIECCHTWVAVAPVGTYRLECPKCHLEKGAWSFLTASEGKPVWTCTCGNDLFVLDQIGALCSRCGERQTWPGGEGRLA
jgi:hypothetical protein